MIRAVLAVGALLLLTLILAGCGQQGESGGGATTTTSSDEETTRSETTASRGSTNSTTPAASPTTRTTTTPSRPAGAARDRTTRVDDTEARNADAYKVTSILDCQLGQATAGMSQQQQDDYAGEVLDEAMRRGKGTSMQDILSERGYDCGWDDYKAKSGRSKSGR